MLVDTQHLNNSRSMKIVFRFLTPAILHRETFGAIRAQPGPKQGLNRAQPGRFAVLTLGVHRVWSCIVV